MICLCIYDKVNCEWGDWNIGDCSKTCGEGTRTNTRVPDILAEHGGVECDGEASIEEECNIQNCPSTSSLFLDWF